MNINHELEQMYHNIAQNKAKFFTIFFGAVFVTYIILFVVDFIPEPVTTVSEAEATAPANEVVVAKEAPESDLVSPVAAVTVIKPSVAANPTKIIFDTLDKEVNVLNPESRDVAVLDNALLSGVVRHPDSADFNNPGNILILGHSSYLPTVRNRNFQAFNGIQKLTWGDTIRVQSSDSEYIYRVDKVYEAKASELVVENDSDKERLTLATCDSFGSTDDRFIVEATLVKTVTL